MPSRRISAPISPGFLQRSASSKIRRFSAPEKRRRLAVGATSGFGTLEDSCPAALRATVSPSGAESVPSTIRAEFSNAAMSGSYLVA